MDTPELAEPTQYPPETAEPSVAPENAESETAQPMSESRDWSDMERPPPERPEIAELVRESRARARKQRENRLSLRLAIWLVGPLATLLVALILIFFVLFDTSTISGPSMMPTLRDHDYVLLTKGLPDPQRGDIVILNVLNKGVAEEWVKRIVAVEGDVVDVNGDIILVNGKAEQFKHLITMSNAATPIGRLTVDPGKIFVAGDNRPLSEDSRYVGTFPVSAIKGRVLFIYAPIWRMGPVPSPVR